MSNTIGNNGRISLHEFAMVSGNVQVQPQNAVGNGAGAPSIGQKIKDAFENFGNKISEKFAAFKEKLGELKQGLSSFFEGVTTRTAERSEARQQLKNERLDAADLKSAGNSSAKIEGGAQGLKWLSGKPEVVSNNLTKLLSDIRTKASEDNVEVPTLKTETMKTLLFNAEASGLREFNPTALTSMITAFEKEGRTEKADFLREFQSLATLAKTPDGAETLFKEGASLAMTKHYDDPTTFLRTTSVAENAAVKKMMDANGAMDYGAAIGKKIETLLAREDVMRLAKDLKQEGIGNMTGDKMTKDFAERLGPIALELLNLALSVAPSDGMKSTLSDLTVEIGNRDDGDGGALQKTLTNKLFTDQLVLKGISPALAKASPVLRMAADFINVTANGIRDQGKYNEGVKGVHQQIAPEIHTKLENFLVSVGMPETSRTVW